MTSRYMITHFKELVLETIYKAKKNSIGMFIVFYQFNRCRGHYVYNDQEYEALKIWYDGVYRPVIVYVYCGYTIYVYE